MKAGIKYGLERQNLTDLGDAGGTARLEKT